jgi:hypothetical protein
VGALGLARARRSVLFRSLPRPSPFGDYLFLGETAPS